LGRLFIFILPLGFMEASKKKERRAFLLPSPIVIPPRSLININLPRIAAKLKKYYCKTNIYHNIFNPGVKVY